METGTLKELNVMPGDVVEWDCDGEVDTVVKVNLSYVLVYGRPGVNCEFANYGSGLFSDEKFRIVSRASDTPTIWRDMTDAEKGALLLAHHDGMVIEWSSVPENELTWEKCLSDCLWDDGFAYRRKPEPKVETKFIDVFYNKGFGVESTAGTNWVPNHRITLTTRDGKVDPVAQVEEL